LSVSMRAIPLAPFDIPIESKAGQVVRGDVLARLSLRFSALRDTVRST
jgi:hypothetical protein